MATVDDVVVLLLETAGTMTAFKLQKLLYYAQGWSLAWDGCPLFDAKIKAYDNGPCVGVVFNAHRGQRHVSRWPQGDASRLTAEERDTVLAVIEKYGAKRSDELVEMTHAEAPWLEARARLPAGSDEITPAALRAFFVGIAGARRPAAPEAAAMGTRLTAFLESADRGDPGR